MIRDTIPARSAVGDPPLRGLRLWIATTPVGGFVVIVAAVFVAELLHLWFLEEGLSGHHVFETVAGGLLHVGITVPVLYVFFVLPSTLNFRRRVRSEEALRVARDELDARVRERTAELEDANQKLRLEIQERRTAEEELRASREKLRELSGRLIKAQEAERARVARDLHDSVGQSLTAMKFIMEGALRRTWADERRKDMAALGSLIPMIQGAVEEIRRISMGLRSSTLDDLGLLATVAWLCREFERTYPGIAIEHDLEVEEAEVPDLLKTVIYRVHQEALNNVAKHSGAERALVTLRKGDGLLEFAVRDNGRGMDPDHSATRGREGGFGLSFMRERVELSGGSFQVESRAGVGTAVKASWPLKGP